MGPVWVIARRELHSMFLSPLAWVVLAVVQFIMAWVLLVQGDTFSLMQQQYLMFQQRAPCV